MGATHCTPTFALSILTHLATKWNTLCLLGLSLYCRSQHPYITYTPGYPSLIHMFEQRNDIFASCPQNIPCLCHCDLTMLTQESYDAAFGFIIGFPQEKHTIRSTSQLHQSSLLDQGT